MIYALVNYPATVAIWLACRGNNSVSYKNIEERQVNIYEKENAPYYFKPIYVRGAFAA